MLERLARWWKYQLDVQRLEALDSHLLADMGLTTEDLKDRVRGRRPHARVPAPPKEPAPRTFPERRDACNPNRLKALSSRLALAPALQKVINLIIPGAVGPGPDDPRTAAPGLCHGALGDEGCRSGVSSSSQSRKWRR